MHKKNDYLLTKMKSHESLIRKKRMKSSYTKINNDSRIKLLEMVYVENYHLKEAAHLLNINYSTAKTILRVFRKEKRVEKKNAQEERNLKALLIRLNPHNENAEKSTFSSEICSNSCVREIELDILGKNKKCDLNISQINYLIKLSNHSSFQLNQNSDNINYLLNYLQRMTSPNLLKN